MTVMRRCSRTGCGLPAGATLTYVYADQTAVLGRLASVAEPHSYDLCGEHVRSFTAPRGWQVVRLVSSFESATPFADDLLAVADAVQIRATPTGGVRTPVVRAPATGPGAGGPAETGVDPAHPAPATGRSGASRRGHLRIIP